MLFRSECLAAYVNEQPNTEAELLLVTDFSRPGELTNAQEAIFLQNDNQPSPMGLNISAFTSQADAAQADSEKTGKLLRWADVLQLAANQAKNR